jgi:hypothetical protein
MALNSCVARSIRAALFAGSGVDKNEAEALARLFEGAIGRFKNSGSHREVDESDVRVALQLLAFASYLLSYVERLAPIAGDEP